MPAHLQFSQLYWKNLLLVAAEVRKEIVVLFSRRNLVSKTLPWRRFQILHDLMTIFAVISYNFHNCLKKFAFRYAKKVSCFLLFFIEIWSKTLPWRRFLRGAAADAPDRQLDPRRCPPSSPCPPAWWSGWRGPPCMRRTAPPSPAMLYRPVLHCNQRKSKRALFFFSLWWVVYVDPLQARYNE